MHPQTRALLRRLTFLRSLKRTPSSARLFTLTRHTPAKTRPQLPFLTVPAAANQQFRYLTTARKRWLVYEVYLGLKYTAYGWAILAFVLLISLSIQLEWLERKFPTPHDWSFISRVRFRLAKYSPESRGPEYPTDWAQVGDAARQVLKRLEDLKKDGAGLKPLIEGGVWIDGIGESGLDIEAKSENWRRGYYEVLMLCAKAAEHNEDVVLDTKRKLCFRANMMIGPSNPRPAPINPGMESAPKEEDCVPFYEPPERYYMKIMTTRGFTARQKMDAALSYATFLDFKELPDAAEHMFQWALSYATESYLPSSPPFASETYVLKDTAGPPSANILTSLTAYATHKARVGDVSSALPILISLLRARRSLPMTISQDDEFDSFEKPAESAFTLANLKSFAKSVIFEPDYPAPPSDGSAPPPRDTKEFCEEAALDLHIGEIIFTGKNTLAAKEEGLTWTREAVDLAELQLHKLKEEAPTTGQNEARTTCRECLAAGLSNWTKMVNKLARDEREKGSTAQSKSSWFGLWSQASEEHHGRWAAEEAVVQERTARVKELLADLQPPQSFIASLVNA